MGFWMFCCCCSFVLPMGNEVIGADHSTLSQVSVVFCVLVKKKKSLILFLISNQLKESVPSSPMSQVPIQKKTPIALCFRQQNTMERIIFVVVVTSSCFQTPFFPFVPQQSSYSSVVFVLFFVFQASKNSNAITHIAKSYTCFWSLVHW